LDWCIILSTRDVSIRKKGKKFLQPLLANIDLIVYQMPVYKDVSETTVSFEEPGIERQFGRVGNLFIGYAPQGRARKAILEYNNMFIPPHREHCAADAVA